MIAEPPSVPGTFHDKKTCVFPAVAVSPVGAAGTVGNIIGLDDADAGPAPAALVAVTVNVYDAPFVNPVTVIGPPVEVAEIFPGLEIAV